MKPPPTFLPILFFFGAFMLGADISAMSLMPLKRLQIPYSPVWGHLFWVSSVGCATLWLVTRRRWGTLSPTISILLCLALLPLPMLFAKAKIPEIPVQRWLTPEQEKSLTYPIYQRQTSGEGPVILVTREHEQELRSELAGMRLLRGDEK